MYSEGRDFGESRSETQRGLRSRVIIPKSPALIYMYPCRVPAIVPVQNPEAKRESRYEGKGFTAETHTLCIDHQPIAR